jgi:hypothetical protein
MKTSVRLLLAATAVVAAAAVAQAECVTKAGKGTGGTDDSAKFQAWEAVLQATDWTSWGAWMVSSTTTIGQAPGYRVTNVKTKCEAGGMLGRQCRIQAKLCKV